MKLAAIHNLFTIKYGNSLELINLEQCEKGNLNSINFVSRTEKNNGISAFVLKVDDIEPNPANTITVAVSGSVLATFLQPEQYYTGFHVLVLSPKKEMKTTELLFYTMCIRKNKYKYNYGRQANKTLKDILVPEQVPEEYKNIDLKKINTLKKESVINQDINLDIEQWKFYQLNSLFKISASRDDLVENMTIGGNTPYITSSEFDNGVINFVDEEATNKANTITANRGGSVGYFFYQPVDYLSTPVDVRILTPKFSINKYIGLFMITVMKLEKYKFNYSRKMGTNRLNNLSIRLPTNNSKPDFLLMETYIKSLPYSKNI